MTTAREQKNQNTDKWIVSDFLYVVSSSDLPTRRADDFPRLCPLSLRLPLSPSWDVFPLLLHWSVSLCCHIACETVKEFKKLNREIYRIAKYMQNR